MSELSFRISEPGKPTREVPIKVGLSVGRLDENTIALADSKISGRHAHVVEKDGALVIEDLGSSNHTHILGGSSLKGGESHPLNVGTMIQLGETKLVVVAAGAESSADKTVAAQMLTLDGGGDDEGGAAATLAMLASFKAAKPRIVLANEAIRRIIDVDKVEFIVGRKEEAANLAIEHQAVSSAHAAIRYESKRFYIEDLGSSNGTFIDNEKLQPSQKRELRPETHVRFGSIDALFVLANDADGNAADPKRYRNAVEVLIAEGTLPASQRDEAVRDAQAAGRHPGEILLEKGLVTVEDWLKAFKKAEFYVAKSAVGGGGSASGNRNILLGLVIILLIIVIVLLAKPSFLGLIGG